MQPASQGGANDQMKLDTPVSESLSHTGPVSSLNAFEPCNIATEEHPHQYANSCSDTCVEWRGSRDHALHTAVAEQPGSNISVDMDHDVVYVGAWSEEEVVAQLADHIELSDVDSSERPRRLAVAQQGHEAPRA